MVVYLAPCYQHYFESAQTAILGLHNIVERPVVENGEVVVRPIMYITVL